MIKNYRLSDYFKSFKLLGIGLTLVSTKLLLISGAQHVRIYDHFETILYSEF